MKVVILCGGLGTRLREETEFRPKPMVPIGPYPILWHIMKFYAQYGFKEFVLCLGYKGEVIKEYFYNYQWHRSDVTLRLGAQPEITYHNQHPEEDWQVTLIDTGQATQTGGRVKRALAHIPDDEFLLTYGDGVCNVEVPKLVEFHRKQGGLATLTAVQPSGRFGELSLNGDKIYSFREKPEAGLRQRRILRAQSRHREISRRRRLHLRVRRAAPARGGRPAQRLSPRRLLAVHGQSARGGNAQQALGRRQAPWKVW